MKKLTKRELKKKAAKVTLLILDVDGVMTGGGIILDDRGNEFKVFHVRDGHGLKMVQRVGINVALITGRESKVVVRRAKELGISEIHQRSRDKVKAYEKVLKKFGATDAEAAYVGDDIVDIPLLRRVGFPITVADADESAKAFAAMVTSNPGGKGAVREVTDYLLKARGLWDDIVKKYAEI